MSEVKSKLTEKFVKEAFNIIGAGKYSEPGKGHLKRVGGKTGKVTDEQTQKGAVHGITMGEFVASKRQFMTGVRKDLAELRKKPNKTKADMAKMKKLEAEVDKVNKAEDLMRELRKQAAPSKTGKKKVTLADTSSITGARAKGGLQAKMKKKGMKAGGAMMMKRRKMASGGSGEGIDPKAIKTKGQFENLLAKGKLEHIPNAKLVDIAIKVGYITGDEMMGNAKGGAMMKKKGMAKGGMKKKGMAMGGLKKPAAGQTGLKKLPTPVRNKMGYAKKGGSMKKKGYAMGGMKKKGYAAGGMSVTYRVGGMAKGKMYGSVDNKKKK